MENSEMINAGNLPEAYTSNTHYSVFHTIFHMFMSLIC